MYLERVSEEVNSLFQDYDQLNHKNMLQVLCTIFEEWSNNQINSLNETNQNLLDDSIDIEIFNPSSIGLDSNAGNSIAQYLFIILEKEKIIKAERLNISTVLSNYIKYFNESKK